MKIRRRWYAVAAAQWLATASLAAQCDVSLRTQLETAERVASSIHPDKPGQMRAFASDGEEYKVSEARWLQANVKLIEQACEKGDEAVAEQTFEAVKRVLKAHHEIG